MSDYISRDAAYESLLNGMVMTGYQSRALDCISEFSIPAADVRPVVRGRWIDTDNYYQRWKCSVCGCHTRDAVPNFCPNCGADMREPLKGTDMGGGIRRDDAGNVIDWGITGPPGDVGKTEEGE